MLKKENRITQNKDFLRIFKTVRPMHTEHFAIRVAGRITNRQGTITRKYPNSNNQKDSPIYNFKGIATSPPKGMARDDNNLTNQQFNNTPSRFGFVISNKIDKRATRRNALKRRIRVAIEEELAQISGGLDVVIQLKKPFVYPYDHKIIKDEVWSGLMKLGIIKRKNV